MNGKGMKFNWLSIGKEVLLLTALLSLAVLMNLPVIKADMMYTEQAIFYGINQLIHTLSDLIHIYTHPQMLDYLAPFFRPSGNFLMYQLLTPWLGWHNTRALLVVNMLFLGLTGYVICKLYQRFFPSFKVGGYIAFGFYAMNPSLMLSKITIMHFEFAYVFFVMTGLYFFIVFCQKNLCRENPRFKFKHFAYLLAAISFYIIAFTFKESSIMLGPVAVSYFICALYRPSQPLKNIINKETFYIFSLWTVVALMLMVYLKLSWAENYHPLLSSLNPGKVWLTAKEFSRFLFSLTCDPILDKDSKYPMLRYAQIPAFTHLCTWVLLFFTTISAISVFRHKNSEFKKSLLFLLLATLLFMLLPLAWGLGFPWHLSLSLVCEGLLLGFGYEYYVGNLISKPVATITGAGLALLLFVSAYQIDSLNISFYNTTPAGFASTLNRNAISHPPAISDHFNADSILVVQDRQNLGDYLIGDSTYPALTIMHNDNFNFDKMFAWGGTNIFWHINPVYNGTLFRWAYLLPNLQEEVIPFTNTDMQLVADALLLDWVRHINNIFCVTYNKNGEWFDNTSVFKKIVLLEQKRRHLQNNQYHSLIKTALYEKPNTFKILPYADPGLCQTVCDNQHDCKGFTYTKVTVAHQTSAKCFFYNKLSAKQKPCADCTAFVRADVKTVMRQSPGKLHAV
jgi:hypothetical protein